MNKPITQTREVIKAAAILAVVLVEDLKDGKFSLGEGLALIPKFGVIRDAIQGIGEVPAELEDLDEEERDTLLGDITDALTGAGLSHRIADMSDEVLKWAYGTVATVIKLRNAPPSAEAA